MKTTPHTFPVQPISLVGRERELAAIELALNNPACRLLTLIGPGGVGKTRLAIEVGIKNTNRFSRGAIFIDLHTVESRDHLISSIADALNIPLPGQEELQLQLFNYFIDKEILLILDNFESLLDEADFVALMLQQASGVKILTTSRQPLDLREEWLFPIDGMSYPGKDASGDLSTYSAVQFFVRCAQRRQPDFSLQVQQSAVVRICQLVDGLPLALEMAATWVNALHCSDIADAILKDIDFLKSSHRNAPHYHHSMKAVFDQSWKRLTQEERSAFQRLSVFKGGFEARAAEEVAGASLSILSSLVDNSILHMETRGRYRLHELIRHYARIQLDLVPEEAVQAQHRFGNYYINFIHNLEADLISRRQKEAIIKVKSEFDNIRTAWRWAIENGDLAAIEQCVMPLSLSYQYQCRYIEGNSMLEEAETALRKHPPSLKRDLILVSVLSELGWLCIRLGKIDDAKQSLYESNKLLEAHNTRPTLAQCFDPRIPLGVIASIEGDHGETARLGEAVLRESQLQGEIWNEQYSFYLLTRAAILKGDLQTAQRHALHTYRLAEQNQDHWFLAYCLNELGNIANTLGNFTAARGHYQTSYELRKEFNDLEGIAVALNFLGDIALKETKLDLAYEYYDKGYKIYQEINDRGGLATSLKGMGQVALAQGDLDNARQYFHKALQISVEIHIFSLTVMILTEIAKLLLNVGKKNEAVKILALVKDHQASEHALVEHTKKIAQDHHLQLTSIHEQSADLEGLVTNLLVWLPALEMAAKSQTDVTTTTTPLINPLTDRECEVLDCIADGLTNQQIAEKLVISPGTAKWYTSQIYSKLGVKKRTQAIAKARELGLIG